MENIPKEVFFNILLRLDLKTLVRLQLVSKHCKNCITSSEFVSLHQHNALENPDGNALVINYNGYSIWIMIDPIYNPSSQYTELVLPSLFRNGPLYLQNPKLVGTANGLVCIGDNELLDRYCLLNPTKRGAFRTAIVPFAQTALLMDDSSDYDLNEHVVSGFGYDEKSDDYKILHVWYWNNSVEALIYSFKFGSWTPIKPPMNRHKPGIHCGLLSNSLHFFTEDMTFIIGFDLHHENWREYELPNIEHHQMLLETSIINGCLSILLKNGREKELWVMKEYGVKESWTKLYTTPPFGFETDAGIFYSKTLKKYLFRKFFGGLIWYSSEPDESWRNIDISHEIPLSHLKDSEMTMIIGSLVPVPVPVKSDMVTRKPSREKNGRIRSQLI